MCRWDLFTLFSDGFLLIPEALLTRRRKNGRRGQTLGLELHGLAAVWEVLIPRDIVMYAFMAIDHCKP